jgi:predicted O-methyltransferase YrrM
MYSKPQLAIKYLRYYFNAASGKGHGIHSPFVFDFIKNVLNDKRNFEEYEAVEKLRMQLEKSKAVIEVEDLGAGSVVSKTKKRSVGEIVRVAAKPKKYAQLLFRIAHYYRTVNMLELGTSLGISSAYLSLANPNGKLYTVEGSQNIAAISQRNFQSLGLKNIEQHIGNFDTELPGIIQNNDPFNLIFFDGNHRQDPTLAYFNELIEKTASSSVFIFDDIHWSAEMESAWDKIKNHPSILLTIDLFFIGLVFFRNDFKVSQHFIIRF